VHEAELVVEMAALLDDRDVAPSALQKPAMHAL